MITAVILGGTSLKGGRGRLAGTLLGLLLIGVLNNGLILLSVEAYWQQVVKGAILLDRGVLRRAAAGQTGGVMTARVGVVGCGWWATRAHLPALEADPDAEIAGVADPDRGPAPGRGRAVRRRSTPTRPPTRCSTRSASTG